VTIGDVKKLNVFLEKNPNLSKELTFVDDYDFEAYESAGFDTKFTDTSPEDAKAVKMESPNLSLKQWMSYAGSVGKISPIPENQSLFGGGVPEGVLRLGGTIVVKGDDVLYQWNDRLPGDHPDIDEVVSIAVSAADPTAASVSS